MWIKNNIQNFFLEPYWYFKRYGEAKRNRNKTTEEVFTDIYETGKWGSSEDGFCSGLGSVDQKIVSPYISMISQKAVREGFGGLNFVDLGCGDFSVGRQLLPLCSSYIGVDIVKPVIYRNQAKYGNENTRFVHLNIVDDALPKGDVCFIRQVLQHLSNQQIATVLPKLNIYKWVFITEHYPTNNDSIEPNKDKVQGSDIRVCYNSGVYLSEPPFELPKCTLTKILEVPGSVGERRDRGVIRTFLYKPVRG